MSIEEEFSAPLPIFYKEPKPVCVCPDLGQENIVKIAETAYGILKSETELNLKMEESIRKRRRMRVEDTGSHNEGGESGEGERTMITGLSRPQLSKSGKSIKTNVEQPIWSNTPLILEPPARSDHELTS